MLALYRLGAYIPAPGINVDAVEDIANNFTGSNVLGFLNLFSGGSLQRFAIFALGIMPYITASIMLQLLTVVIPQLDKLRKEGEVGQQLITQRGIGNGISLMIFASIASGLPNGIQAWWTNPDQIFVMMMPFMALAIIAGIVFMQEGQRRIPIQYAKRVVGRRMAGGGSTYLPLRVNMAGVIPVIFAASLMAFPPTVGELTQASWAQDFSTFFSPNGAPYLIGESIFIILFTYFYTAVTFNPVEQADNLKKYGGFIPRGRTRRPT